MILLLLLGGALADEPRSVFLDTGDEATANEPSWLVPEPYFDRCLIQGRELQIVYGALDRCVTTSLPTLETDQAALTQCATKLDQTADQMDRMSRELNAALARLAVREEQTKDLRRQRNIAVLTAALVVGSAATGVALAL